MPRHSGVALAAAVCACVGLAALGPSLTAFVGPTQVPRSVRVQGSGPSAASVLAGASAHTTEPFASARLSGAAAAAAAVAMAAAGALIVQNKGGGHGEIGFHLALGLRQKGLKVTMIQDSAAKKNKPPFDSYGDLESAGVEVKWADLAEGGLASALEGVAPCEYVFDNQNVCPGEVQKAVSTWSPKAYAYVSSGGMYKPVPEGPLLETGDVKEDNKQLSIERSAAAEGLAWSAYRPQYIYGPKTGKRDYLDWFLDRVTRGLPIPLPADGELRTTLTNAEDVAGMLASVVGKEDAAKGQVFNCATDVRVSHKEVVSAVAKAVGKDPAEVLKTVVCYDPAALKGVELPKGGKFPFRETHFGVGVEKAKDVLGWAPSHTLEQDLPSYFEEYKRQGKDKGDVDRAWDEAVIGAISSPA